MNAAELNYPTHEQEMLAIIHCIKIWRVYLLDGGCTIETDHRSLERVLTQKSINRRICRWYDLLADFQLRFKYIPGATNIVADALSRRQDFEIDFLGYKQKQMNAVQRLKPATLVEMIRKSQRKADINKEFVRIQNEETVGRYAYSQAEDVVNCIINNQPKILIPEDDIELQNAILWELHDIAVAGHPGIDKTILAVAERFYWKRMHKRIKEYIATCESCQRNKSRPGKAPGLLHPLEIPTGRWTSIGIDFITGLPKTKSGYDTIIVIADRLTKQAHFTETVSTITSEDLAELFIKVHVRIHGLPSDITTDRDTKFTAKFWKRCAELLGTKLNLATAHHQRTDGQVERINGILSSYLRHYVGGFQNDWDRHLPLAEFAYNRQSQATIGMSPFYADMGYNPCLPADLHLPTAEETPAIAFLKNQQKVLREIQAKLRIGAEKMKHLYDRGKRDQKFTEGEMVLISTKNFDPQTVGATRRKFAAKWIGPYEVVKSFHDGASYELNLPKELGIHPVFHTMVLKKFQRDTTGIQRDSTIPTVRLKDGTEGHLIEAIIDHRITKHGVEQYRCKWVGRDNDITWEPTKNLLSVPGLIREYHRKSHGRPLRTSLRLKNKHKLHAAHSIRHWRDQKDQMDFAPKEIVSQD